jgi:hypothetical protein
MQDVWLAELHRIVKPGGILVITIHGRNATKTLSDEAMNALLTKGFLHLTSKKMNGILPDWYHTTWHSREYVFKCLSRWFENVSYFEVPDGAQAFVVGYPKLPRPSISVQADSGTS